MTSPQNNSVSPSPDSSASSFSPFPSSSSDTTFSNVAASFSSHGKPISLQSPSISPSAEAESCAEAAVGPVEVGNPECAERREEEARELELAAHQPKAEVRRVAIDDGEGAVSASDGLRDAGRGHERQSEGVFCGGLGNHDELALLKEQEEFGENEE